MFDSKPPISPLSRFAIFLLIGGCLLVLTLWGALTYLPTRPAASTTAKGTSGSNKAAASSATASTQSPGAGAASNPSTGTAGKPLDLAAIAEIKKTIGQTLAVLNDPTNLNKAAALAALKESLAQAEPAVAIAAIRQFLSGGQDGKTGQGFKVGEGGVLEESPTLRTLLMDELGTLSTATGAADAAEVAREVLNAKNSPDEWALAMRNLAWSDPEGSKALLAAKAREMLNYAPWQQSPSGGYQEAFDAIAYSGDASLIADLEPLSKTKSPLQQAALVALDRLSAMAPAQVADYLNNHPDTLADRPLMRADYMGKVDLSDAAQKGEAETYLQRGDVSAEEKSKFLARLGMPAGFVSNNLLTPSEIVTMPLIERRALVNQTANDWLTSGRFPTLQTDLQKLISNTQSTGGS